MQALEEPPLGILSSLHSACHAIKIGFNLLKFHSDLSFQKLKQPVAVVSFLTATSFLLIMKMKYFKLLDQ